jgi:hypothetical protein
MCFDTKEQQTDAYKQERQRNECCCDREFSLGH